MRRHASVAVAVLLALAGAGAAAAADYPTKPVTLIVPLAAGSTADILARTVAAFAAETFGQSVVVDDRPGAGGAIAEAQVARAAPDGYTIAVITQGTQVFDVGLYPKLEYDPLKDFAPITLAAAVSNVMIVPPDSPYRSVADVIAGAKAQPGVLTFSSGGAGTSHHLSGVLFEQMTGTKMTHVAYRGAPQGISAVMAGEVALGFFNTPTVLGQVRDGKLRGLAVTSLARSPHLPDLPTLDEAGIKGYEVSTWLGFGAPAGTPAPIVARWHDAIAAALADPAIHAKMAALGFDPVEPLAPDAFGRFIAADLEKWVPIVKASGATAY
ncbi:MAG TPA: tripartite tricarboxylate transporter substrate binding protein [Candidatus Sulfotelmatobacter sp.]|nr:tripartite tricarboxylate transporter substrate binding protein [Candidatus Sulfotelmatobacter sp.]